jgi:hypothetical protein
VNREKVYLNNAAMYLAGALKQLEWAEASIAEAFDGYDPGYPAPDTQDARAWDYLDAIREAARAIGHRLNTWDKGDYDE